MGINTRLLYNLTTKTDFTGIINLGSGSYIFRDDHGYEPGIWAWNIHGDYDRARVHKWGKFPKRGLVELFNIEDPPATVSYQPLLD